MNVLKIILLLVVTVSVPLTALFLIRLALKIGRSVDHLNRTLEDARPHLNMLLSDLDHTVRDINGELDRVGQMTVEAQEMLDLTEASLRAVDSALRSPAARLGGMLAGFATTTFLFRGIARRTAHRSRVSPKRRAT